jgi:NAD(P)-dependent dehydrogenase (short-subunit alcohol dehydrogenase family)
MTLTYQREFNSLLGGTAFRSVCVITGVTRGIGRALLTEFSLLGFKVFGCARTLQDIELLSREYPQHGFAAVDVSKNEEIRGWAEGVLSEAGPPGILLNNAAILTPKMPVWQVADEDFSAAMDTNVKGVVNTLRAFIPAMMGLPSGLIVNFSSRWGTKFQAGMVGYCASKWAVLALTRVLGEELKTSKLSVVALNPGVVGTQMLKEYSASYGEPAMNSCSPSEWAKYAVPRILALGPSDSGKLRCIFPAQGHRVTTHAAKCVGGQQ